MQKLHCTYYKCLFLQGEIFASVGIAGRRKAAGGEKSVCIFQLIFLLSVFRSCDIGKSRVKGIMVILRAGLNCFVFSYCVTRVHVQILFDVEMCRRGTIIYESYI